MNCISCFLTTFIYFNIANDNINELKEYVFIDFVIIVIE